MKTIKSIKTNLYILLVLISSSVFAQTTHDPDNAPYVGTWQYQNGNTTFKLTIWESSEVSPSNKYYLHGNYEMAQISGGVTTVIYTSNPYKAPDFRFDLSTFDGAVIPQNDGTKLFGGSFRERHAGGSGYTGDFTIIKLPPCSGCPEKISWKVTKSKGLQTHSSSAPSSDFVVPNNIELTKVP